MDTSNSTATADTHHKRKSQRPTCGYKGYRVQDADIIQSVTDSAAFRSQYIDKRRPAKLAIGAPIDASLLCLNNIVETLNYHEPLQVERKVDHGFGSGKVREKMVFAEIVKTLKSGDDSLYLTTQYEENEGEDLEGAEGAEEGEELESTEEGEELESTEEGEELENTEEGEELENTEEGDTENEDVEGDEEDTNKDTMENSKKDTKKNIFNLPNSGISKISSPQNASESESDFEVDFSNLHDDYEESDADDFLARVRTLFQPPLTNLARNKTSPFPIVPEPFKGLFTQQINLWMGASRAESPTPDLSNATLASLGKYVPRGNSSGLHHDHADNLYFLVEGRKRFTLFSPENAQFLATVGDINKIYPNGLVDYQVNANARFWRPMREDGAIQAEWAHWMLEKGDFSQFSEAYLHDLVDNEPRFTGDALPLDPPSFSRIPPVLLHLDEVDPAYRPQLIKMANDHFPGLLKLNKMEVWLEPGDLLYIPVGWFHEVTSFSDDAENAHVAVNWWFMPPSATLEKPYEDDYWKEDFALTMEAVEEFRG